MPEHIDLRLSDEASPQGIQASAATDDSRYLLDSRGFQRCGEFGWIGELPTEVQATTLPVNRKWTVFENGKPLGPSDSLHSDIARLGLGRFSVWHQHIYLSTSDGSDPRTNERAYQLGPALDSRICQTLARLPAEVHADRRALLEQCLSTVLQSGQLEALDEVMRHTPLRGRDVLEIGCGQCWVAPFFLGAGARTYTGVELIGPLRESRVFDRMRAGGSWTNDCYLETPLSLPELLGEWPQIQYVNADFGKTTLSDQSYDVVFLRVTSEHLLEPRRCFHEIHRLMRPGAILYLSHGNYQAWNGHHVVPHNVSEIDFRDHRQAAVVDWAHLQTFVENTRTDGHCLNYLRAHELIGLLNGLFKVERVDRLPTPPETGGARLTEPIRAALSEYYSEELLCDMLYVVCRKVEGRPLHALISSWDPLPGLDLRALLDDFGVQHLTAWLRNGGPTLEVSRITGLPAWMLVELAARIRREQSEI